MPHFTKRLETKQGHLSFYFNRIYTAAGMRYHVSVIERDRKAIIFHMQDESGSWDISPDVKLPSWIKDVEAKLRQAVEEHLSNV